MQVVGEASNVRDALIQIVLRLRDDVLKDRVGGHTPSVASDPTYSNAPGLSVPSVLSTVPSVASVNYQPRAETGTGVGILSSNNLYGYGSFPVSNHHTRIIFILASYCLF